MLPNLLAREGKDVDHDRVSAVATVDQTLWMDFEPLRCES